MVRKNYRLIEKWVGWEELGIIKILQSDFDFLTDDDNYYYYIGHSGNKIISPLIEVTFKNGVTVENVNKIKNIILSKFSRKWRKIYESLYTTEYDAVSNYSMNEVRTPDLTDVMNFDKDVTRTVSQGGNASIYAFNSSSPTPKNNANVTITENEKNALNKNKNTLTKTGSETINRKGFSGVTPQSLIEDEIKLRVKYNIIDIMFSDIDTILTLNIY